MHNILHQLVIRKPAAQVFEAIALPQGLDAWWTLESAGTPTPGSTYRFYFGGAEDWKAVVQQSVPNQRLEWLMTHTQTSPGMEDWLDTRLVFALSEKDGRTTVNFEHLGWRTANDHYRISNYCWAGHLQLLKAYCEKGTIMPHADRLLL